MYALRTIAMLVFLVVVPAAHASFVTFESGPVRPLALSPDGTRLFAVNTPDDRLEIFDVSGGGVTLVGSVPVGLEPVAVAARSDTEVWVVNHLSDSVSVVDVGATPPRVTHTLLVGDEPRDIVFAGPDRAFITTAHRGQNSGVPTSDFTTSHIGRADVWVFNAGSLGGTTLGGTPLTVVNLFGDTPRALAVSPDGNTVYAAVFHSGNRTTTVSEGAVCDGGSGAGTCTVDGAMMPGGLPAPNTNCAGNPQPETGLVVKFNPAHNAWEDRGGRNWSGAVRFSLPDEDVFAIDATGDPPDQVGMPYTGVGTIIFNIAVNPVSGKVYVSNTDANNADRFEGIAGTCGNSSLRGHLAESRITVLDGASVLPRHLNKHLVYSQVPSPAGAKDKSLATPLGMAVTPDGTKLYVAAFGSGTVGTFSTAALENDTFVPDAASHIALPLSAGGPSGLVLRGTRLYVATRFDDGISVVDTATNMEIAHVSLHNPEPASVVVGRPFLYDAVNTSSNGEAACASCHIFGDFDSLAWDLGDPTGTTLNDPNPIEFNAGQDPDFAPLKGPMTTQSLRGMANHGAMHWRGDRTGGNDPGGDPLDENAAFKKFIVAFDGLLGRGSAIADGDMQKFTDFILQVTYPPNPIRDLDNVLKGDQLSGRNKYFQACNNLGDPGCSDSVRNCNGCHTLDPANGFFGSQGRMSFEAETQMFKVPHLRNLYQKIGMFGMPNVAFFKPLPAIPNEDQVRGFGFLHDGSVDTMFRFHNANVFNLSQTVARQMEQFMLAFDSNLAPIVGQQVTLRSDNGGAVGTRIDLFIARAAAGECDVVVKGDVGGEQRGWVRNPAGTFESDRSDRTAEPLLSDGDLRAKATPGHELTYTCVPPGSGRRIGIDRDEDGFPDRTELDAGSDPADAASIPGSGSTTTTTAVSGTTTTTTNPSSCIQLLKAKVKVKTKHDVGLLTAKLLVPINAYDGEPVTVTLRDADSPTIATQAIGALPPRGNGGERWRFRSSGPGVTTVLLEHRHGRAMSNLSVNAEQWFTAAAANQSAGDTVLRLQIGSTCFEHAATKKID